MRGEYSSTTTQQQEPVNRHPWRQEFGDVVRGLAGGFLFGIPLLYTMEAWWIGVYAEPWRLLLLLLFALVINWMLAHFSGFRRGTNAEHPVGDAVEALAIGIVGAAVTLAVLGELRFDRPLAINVGMVALESVPFSLGVSIANGFLSGSKDQPKNDGDDTPNKEQDQTSKWRPDGLHGTLLDAGATVAGALFISFSIAPTMEVPMITGNVGDWNLIVFVVFSLIVSYIITFEADFADQQAREQQQGIFQGPATETIFSYLLSLLVAVVLLLLFKQISLDDPWHVWLGRTIVLGLPATIGGSAGRLAAGG